jgi:nitroreductase
MINKLITDRRSTVLFASRSIDSETIKLLFEAARWAPSSLNQQPWRFVYAQKGDVFYNALLSCLFETNQVWAKNAPLLICTIAQRISDYKDRENIYSWHDTAMAYASLVFQATSMGLSAHPMGGFDKEKAVKLLEIPERYEPITFAAIGYRSSSNDFPDELLNRESKKRIRNELQEIVYHGKFLNDFGL